MRIRVQQRLDNRQAPASRVRISSRLERVLGERTKILGSVLAPNAAGLAPPNSFNLLFIKAKPLNANKAKPLNANESKLAARALPRGPECWNLLIIAKLAPVRAQPRSTLSIDARERALPRTGAKRPYWRSAKPNPPSSLIDQPTCDVPVKVPKLILARRKIAPSQ